MIKKKVISQSLMQSETKRRIREDKISKRKKKLKSLQKKMILYKNKIQKIIK